MITFNYTHDVFGHTGRAVQTPVPSRSRSPRKGAAQGPWASAGRSNSAPGDVRPLARPAAPDSYTAAHNFTVSVTVTDGATGTVRHALAVRRRSGASGTLRPVGRVVDDDFHQLDFDFVPGGSTRQPRRRSSATRGTRSRCTR